MAWLTDLFKDVPLSLELREKLAAVEMELDAAKTDNVILKDDLRQAKAEILRVERKLEQFAHESELDETDIRILKEVALTSEPPASYLSTKLNIELGVVDFRLEQLTDTDYLSAWTIGGVERYSLRPKGREYLIKHNLTP
jgi:predicted RNase H-like nuclease (RuvC/YqgF family)